MHPSHAIEPPCTSLFEIVQTRLKVNHTMRSALAPPPQLRLPDLPVMFVLMVQLYDVPCRSDLACCDSLPKDLNVGLPSPFWEESSADGESPRQWLGQGQGAAQSLIPSHGSDA